MPLVECYCSIFTPDDFFNVCLQLGSQEKKNNKGGRWVSEVPWLTVGLVVGHQSIRTRVLVISWLVLLTPRLLVPELHTQITICYL